jgi:hypothetical protein
VGLVCKNIILIDIEKLNIDVYLDNTLGSETHKLAGSLSSSSEVVRMCTHQFSCRVVQHLIDNATGVILLLLELFLFVYLF